jgi:hypothetical protein
MFKMWLKRMLPFIATFALGIFIASFFVSVAPGSRFGERRFMHRQEMQRLQADYDAVKLENQRLKSKLAIRERSVSDPVDLEEDEWTGGELPLHRPPPPPPSRKAR